VFISTASANFLKLLISPEELYDRLDEANPIILDIRGDAYNEGHIQGSISAPYAF
jgi:thiosulfate/3-mercaptopyruvate sulfurtransferase